jgi:hypothetical protein
MLRKAKSDARWNQLTPEQQQMLDKWLFEDNLSFAKVLPRAQKQLGYKGQMTSLKRYHKRRAQERLLTDMTGLAQDAATVEQTGAKPGAFRSVNMNVFNAYLYQALRASPDKLEKLAPLIRVMVQNDRNDALREIKDADNKIRHEKMAFARERYEFDLMAKALRALPQLKELEEAKKDPHTKRYEENAYWNQVRHLMFGKGIDVHPESAQEEAELAAARKAREERRQRELAVQDNVTGEAQPPAPSSPHYEEYVKAQARWDLEYWGMGAEYEI